MLGVSEQLLLGLRGYVGCTSRHSRAGNIQTVGLLAGHSTAGLMQLGLNDYLVVLRRTIGSLIEQRICGVLVGQVLVAAIATGRPLMLWFLLMVLLVAVRRGDATSHT